MGRKRRRWETFSNAEIGLVWRRWRAGVRLDHIARELERSTTAVKYLVVKHGGIAPAARRRAAQSLSAADREEISRGLARGQSIREIAAALGRAPSTISREIRRHGGATKYRAATADAEAWRRARRPKLCRLAELPRLRRLVETKLHADWSPQQIAGWLMATFPGDPTLHISHEAIYRTLYVQTRGALKRELVAHLRKSRGYRQSRKAAQAPDLRGQIVDPIPISARPPEAADRAVPGHWEGDLLAGTKWSNIATLVERHSRYVMLVRLPDRNAPTVVRALARRIQRLPASLKQSLTWDRGKEMAQHKAFTVATDVQVYFCDPRSPWQRGSNENTNGLLRQYFPKGEDVSQFTQRQLDAIALKLNTRPRQTLGWKTPAQALAAAVALTG
jgi:IS30 family transposase